MVFVFKIKLSNCKIFDNDKMKNYSTVKTKIHRHCFEHLKNNYINDIDINNINGISIKNDRIATIKFAVENEYFEEYKSRCKDDYIYILNLLVHGVHIHLLYLFMNYHNNELPQ